MVSAYVKYILLVHGVCATRTGHAQDCNATHELPKMRLAVSEGLFMFQRRAEKVEESARNDRHVESKEGVHARCPVVFGKKNILPVLPVLKAPGLNKSWDAYLARVYGRPVSREHYPIDLNAFEWFYPDAPILVEPLEAHLQCDVPFGGAFHGTKKPEQLLWSRTKGFFIQRYRKGSDERAMGIVGPSAWVEIIHVAMDEVAGANITGDDGKRPGEVGTWYFRAIGSGVFLNTGERTLVVSGSAKPPWQFHLPTYKARGVQTIQAPISIHNWEPMRNNRFEIVDLRRDGEMEPCPGQYRTGFAAADTCQCDQRKGVSNCS